MALVFETSCYGRDHFDVLGYKPLRTGKCWKDSRRLEISVCNFLWCSTRCLQNVSTVAGTIPGNYYFPRCVSHSTSITTN